MKCLIKVVLIAALVSLVVGIISRMTFTPLMYGLEANAFLRFTDTCLLFAIALGLLEILKTK